MVRRLVALVAVVLLTGAVTVVTASAAGAPVTVDIVNFAYQPTPAVVAVGDSVSFRNVPPNATHSAVFDTPGSFTFDTGEINPGETSAPITATTPGTFTYYCGIHGRSMTGVLTVLANPVVPESRWPVLLGVSGVVVVAAAAAFILRRQRHARS